MSDTLCRYRAIREAFTQWYSGGWVGNDGISEAGYFLPQADALLAHVALQTLGLVSAGSVVGRGASR